MFQDTETRDWKVRKFLAKFATAYPGKKPPTYTEIGEMVDRIESLGQHVTYPLAGTAWNQADWQREYSRKNQDK